MGSFLLRWLLSFWVKVKVLPKDEQWMAFFKGKKVCYVTRSDMYSKHIILEQVCRDVGMPLPSDGLVVEDLTEQQAVFALNRIKGGHTDAAPAYLLNLMETVQFSKEDVLIVPVSIFWGRGPRKSESLWGALFTDEGVKSSVLSRFMSILFNGRQTLLRFGEAVSLQEFVENKRGAHYLTRKLTRVLRVHFARTRLATIGPDQPSPKKLANKILQIDLVQQAIAREVGRNKMTQVEAEKQAKAYALEIAAVVNIRAALVLEKILGWLWNKLYDGIVLHHFARVERLSREHQIVYVPSHQSHMDYLVLSYVLFNRGLAPPHVAAGINLNIPIAGPWIRRCGAFFLRRTFKGNILYGAVFEAYMGYLANNGTAVEYFVEGGRSRTGRKLKAKPGLLAMSVRSYLREHKRSVVFLPVNFAYEKLVEGETYVNELSGKPKKAESFMGVLRSFKALKNHFGQVHVNFGSPIYLDAIIEELRPDWRREDLSGNKELVTKLVNNLGEKIMSGINEATHVNAIGLLAMALLNTSKQSMLESELRKQLGIYLALLKAVPYSKDVTCIELDPAAIIAYGEEFGVVKRQSSEAGELLSIEGNDAILMTYFRNNIVHLFVLPSFLACCFLSNESLTKKQVVHWFKLVYPFLKSELSMHWSHRQISLAATKVVGCLVDLGVLKLSADNLSVSSKDQKAMHDLSRGVSLSLERFYLTVVLLQQQGKGQLTRLELEKRCGKTAEKLSEINGLNSPEFFDKASFKGFIEMLFNQDIIWADNDGKLTYGKILESIIDDAGLVMSQQVRKNIYQTID
ncbi:MAG: glycerol-3-phosphate 1-O-acyltransferase [Cycloclasticus sp. symbiont of Bathymodiolus heckerae]|nr:MAG: glycerol-3-phosphate 1-O-acyltransferase [Cycloclasticus sp. symbiont of Bathymodiolus heckerae]